MKLFHIDNNYIDYLKKFEPKIQNHSGITYSKKRKYLGILLEMNDCKYIAPLSSPKKTDYNPDGSIRKSIVPLIRITHKNKLLGTIKLNNMIPFYDEKVVMYYDLSKEDDKNYKALIINELEFIYTNKELIIKNAKKIYQQKEKELNIGYIKNTLNFKLLEEKAKKYDI